MDNCKRLLGLIEGEKKCRKIEMLASAGIRNQLDVSSQTLPPPAPSGRRHISTSKQPKLKEPDMDEATGAIAANRCAHVLKASEKEDELTSAVNLLLVLTFQLEIQLDADGQNANPMLDGLTRLLRRCFPNHAQEKKIELDLEEDDFWSNNFFLFIFKDNDDVEQQIMQKICTSGTMALLTIVRNLANVPTNRVIIANHVDLVQIIIQLLHPKFFGLPSVLLVSDIASSIARYLELGGAYLADPYWLPVLSSSFVNALVGEIQPLSRDESRWKLGLYGLAPPYHKLSKTFMYPTQLYITKRRAAIQFFAIVRFLLLYAINSDALTFCLPLQARVYVKKSLTCLTITEKRQLALRSLEVLASIKNNVEYNLPLLTSMPADVIYAAISRTYWRAPGTNRVDSELRLAALELLALIAELRFPAPAPKIIAAHHQLVHICLATLIVSHNKYAQRTFPTLKKPEQTDIILQPNADQTTQLNLAQQQALKDASGGRALFGLNSPLHSSLFHDTHHHSYPSHDSENPLIPPRAHRAETVRLISNLLAGIYFHRDQNGRRELKQSALQALAPVAANDDTVSDLLFNRLSAPDD